MTPKIDWGMGAFASSLSTHCCRTTKNGLRICNAALMMMGDPDSVDFGRIPGQPVMCLREGTQRAVSKHGGSGADVCCTAFIGEGKMFPSDIQLDWNVDGGVLFLQPKSEAKI